MPVILSSRLRRRRLSLSRVHSLAENILKAAGASRSGVSLLLVGDRSMQRLNRLYRRKDRTTDVLAFPMRHVRPRFTLRQAQGPEPSRGTPHASPFDRLRVPVESLWVERPSQVEGRFTSSMLGDIVISLPQAARQAAEAGHSLEREVAVLVIHGVLHLLGYDHERSAREARRMSRREQAVLRTLGTIPKLIANRK